LAIGTWGAPGAVEIRRFLGIQDNTAVVAALTSLGAGTTVLLVGHLPQMGDIARILAGDADIPSPTPGTIVVLQGRPEPSGCKIAARYNAE
jgi:phosphohistidine phosphatase SixA